MPETGEVQQRVVEIFTHKLSLAVPSVDTDLFTSGGLDSLLFVDLLLHIEQEFNVKIPLHNLELEHFRSMRKIAEFIAHTARQAREKANGGSARCGLDTVGQLRRA